MPPVASIQCRAMPIHSPDQARRVCTYLSPEQSAAVAEAAAREGLSVSSFIRRLVITVVQQEDR
jgi:uncharacterized protein (DUF1778 family)